MDWPEAVSCIAAAYPASVSLLRVVSPRLAHSIILPAIILPAMIRRAGPIPRATVAGGRALRGEEDEKVRKTVKKVGTSRKRVERRLGR